MTELLTLKNTKKSIYKKKPTRNSELRRVSEYNINILKKLFLYTCKNTFLDIKS